MNRRHFLTASAAAITALSLSPTTRARARAATTPAAARQWIQIRTYHFTSPEKLTKYADFLSASVPSLTRAGAKTVGLFRQLAADNPKLKLKDDNDLFVILAHESPTDVADFEPRLAADSAYQSAGKDLLQSDKSNPAFARVDVELLESFEGFPTVHPRDLNETRVLEMRTYESATQERAQNKIAMFNAGEIPLFERANMPGIFWARALAGQDLPHLTYMVHHASLDQAPKNWKAFSADPDWNKLKAEPQYKDNVSKIINRFLRHLPNSQI
jgi:hypothetical protein